MGKVLPLWITLELRSTALAASAGRGCFDFFSLSFFFFFPLSGKRPIQTEILSQRVVKPKITNQPRAQTNTGYILCTIPCLLSIVYCSLFPVPCLLFIVDCQLRLDFARVKKEDVFASSGIGAKAIICRRQEIINRTK